MKLILYLLVSWAIIVSIQQTIAAETVQGSTISKGVAIGISKRSAKDHTLYFSTMNDERKSTCPIYQRKLFQLKYNYYTFIFKIKYFFIWLIDCLKEYYYSTKIDQALPWNITRQPEDSLKISKHSTRREVIKEIIHKLPEEERKAANELHRKWVTDCHMFGQQIIYTLKKQAEERDELINAWNDGHRQHTTILHDHLKEDKYLESDDTKLRLLFINQDWILTRYRLNRLHKQHYKSIFNLHFDNNKEDQPMKFAPLYDMFDSYQSIALIHTQLLVFKSLNQTQSELEWQLYQSYIALKENRIVLLVRENHILAKKNYAGIVVFKNRQYQSLIPRLLAYWDDIPENSLPYSFFSKTSYWQILLYCLQEFWQWICDILKQCLHNSNQVQKKKLHDVIDYLYVV